MARRQPYEHTATPPQPDASTDVLPPEEKVDPFVQSLNPPGEPLEVRLEEPEITIAEPLKKEEKPEVTASEPEQRKPSADDEAFNRLKAQLDRERQAREAAQQRAQQLQSDHSAAQERLRAEQERMQAIQRDHYEAQEIAIDNAISFAESQAVQAQREITRALSEGDYEASSTAYRLLAKAESDLSRLKEGKSAIEVQKNAPAPESKRQEPQPSQPQSTFDRVEAYITQPGHSPQAQQFMRDHYDDLFKDFDTGAARLQRLLGGHYLTKSEGIVEGSNKYFDYLAQHMGYQEVPEAPAPASAPPPKKSIPPSAPVSRSATSGSNSPNTVTLTPAQVAFCRESGVSPADYARMLLRAKNGATDPGYTGPRFTADQL